MTWFQRTWRIAPLAAAALGFTTALASQCQLALQPGEPVSGPQGFVSALVLDGQGQPVIGGDFLFADGAICNRIARWNGSSWQPLGSGVDAGVRAIATLPNGDIVAGGSFTLAGGQPAAAIARWNGSSWSPMGAGLPGQVTALQLASNGELWAGISVQDIASIHRFDGVAWQQVGTDFSVGLILDLAELPNGDWVAGGLIGTAGGQPAIGLARWNGAVWQPTGGMSTFARVDSIAVRPNGDLVLGGALRVGTTVGAIATIDALGTQLVPSPLGTGAAQVGLLPNGDVVAGTFLPAGPSSSAVAIAQWNGVSWTPLTVQVPAPGLPVTLPTPSAVHQLQVDASGRVVVNDNFRIRRLEAGAWSLLAAPQPPQIAAMTALPGGDLLVGGIFSSLGGVAADRVARWNGSAWSPLGLGVDGPVQAIAAAPNGDVIVGGNFTQAGGGAASRVARFDGTFWTTLGAGLVNPPTGLAVGGDGSVFAIGGGLGGPMSRFDGQTWSPLALGGFLGAPQELAVGADGNVLVAGQFGGLPTPVSLLRWNGTALAPVPTAPSGFARGVAVAADGSVLLAGTFVGTTATLVRVDASGWSPVGSPILSGQGGDVAILADGDLVVTGFNLSSGGTAIGSPARFDGTTWSAVDASWSASGAFNSATIDVAATDRGELFLAGPFARIGNVISAGLVRATTPCPAAATPIGAGCVGSAGALTLAAQNRPWAGGTFRARLQTLPANALALHVVGFQPFAAALPLGAPGCSLLVDPVAIALVVPNAGVGAVELAVPASVSAVGLSLRSQGIGAELDAQGNLVRTTSSNALRLVVGAL